MQLENAVEIFNSIPNYSAELSDDLILINNNSTDSEFVAEVFDGSIQVRQAVIFELQAMTRKEVDYVRDLCMMLNERFSLTKLFVDRWSVLVNASDLHHSHFEARFAELILKQVEFMSLAALSIWEISMAENRGPIPLDVDNMFASSN